MLIYLDWGSSQRRAYRFDGNGNLQDQRMDDRGVKSTPPQEAEASLVGFIGDWMQTKPVPKLLLSGMATAREGWHPHPCLTTPLNMAQLPQNLIVKTTTSCLGQVWLIPGLRGQTEDGAPEFMRGEETQLYLAAQHLCDDHGMVVLPGTHSKWVQFQEGCIARFKTFLTGELFGLLDKDSLLKSGSIPTDLNPQVFEAGVCEASASPGGPGALLHLLFRARARMLAGQIHKNELSSWISGLMIGSEITESSQSWKVAKGQTIRLLGNPRLVERYVHAMKILGFSPEPLDLIDLIPNIWKLANQAGLIEEGSKP